MRLGHNEAKGGSRHADKDVEWIDHVLRSVPTATCSGYKVCCVVEARSKSRSIKLFSPKADRDLSEHRRCQGQSRGKEPRGLIKPGFFSRRASTCQNRDNPPSIETIANARR